MKIAIIEDEKLTANDLARTIISIDPDAEIIVAIASVEEGIAYLKSGGQPDLIFSDIQLGDGLSFEIFEQTGCRIPIIFCTAFDEYALKAFKTVGIDYLLKPFSRAAVSKALEKFAYLKFSFAAPATDYSNLLSSLRQQLQPAKIPSVIIQQADKIIPLDGAQVALFYIDDKDVIAYTFSQKKHVLSHKLDALEKLFSPAFFRANRQHLVNRKAVRDAEHFSHRKIVVNLIIPFPEPVMIGKLKVTAFVEWLASY